MNKTSLCLALAKRAMSPPIVISSIKTAFFVGLTLNLINHGPSVFDGSDISWLRLLFNFVVPFGVSAYSGAWGACNACEPGVEHPGGSSR